MSPIVIAAVVVLLGSMLFSRMLSMRSMNILNSEQKGYLVELTRKMSRYQVIALVLLIALLFLGQRYMQQYMMNFIIGYFVIMILYSAYRFYFMYTNFKAFGFPENYMRQYIYSFLIQAVGILLFAALILTSGELGNLNSNMIKNS